MDGRQNERLAAAKARQEAMMEKAAAARERAAARAEGAGSAAKLTPAERKAQREQKAAERKAAAAERNARRANRDLESGKAGEHIEAVGLLRTQYQGDIESVLPHLDAIAAGLLAEHPESDPDARAKQRGLATAFKTWLLTARRDQGILDQLLAQPMLGTVVSLLNLKHIDCVAAGSIESALAGSIAMRSREDPASLVSVAQDLFDALGAGNSTAGAAVINLHGVAEEVFMRERNIGAVLGALEGSERDASGGARLAAASMTLQRAAKLHPGAFVPLAPRIMALCQARGGSVAQLLLPCLVSVSRHAPAAVVPLLDDVFALARDHPALRAHAATVAGGAARAPGAHVERCVSYVTELIENPQTDGPVADRALRVMAGLVLSNTLPRQRLEPLQGRLAELRGQGGEMGTLCADVMALAEGRTVEGLAARVDAVEESVAEVHERVQEVETKVEDVREELHEEIANVKDFVAEVVKKLPGPASFMVDDSNSVRKALILGFQCCRQNAGCLYPEARPFTTETTEYTKWVKMGMSLAKLGKAAVHGALGSVGGAAAATVDAFKGVYDAMADTNDAADFETFTREPFLTSAEQDKLIGYLRGAHYFDFFEYSAQDGDWACTSCLHGGGRINSPPEAAAAAEEGKGEDEAPPQPVEREGPVLHVEMKKPAAAAAPAAAGAGSAPAWQPDRDAPACGCGRPFTLFFRRHHCRQCGLVKCSKCTMAREVVPRTGNPARQRVCQDCVPELRAAAPAAAAAAPAAAVAETTPARLVLGAEELALFHGERRVAGVRLNDVRKMAPSRDAPHAFTVGAFVVAPESDEERDQWLADMRHNIAQLDLQLQRKGQSAGGALAALAKDAGVVEAAEGVAKSAVGL